MSDGDSGQAQFNLDTEARKLRRALIALGISVGVFLCVALGAVVWRLWLAPYGRTVWQLQTDGETRILLVRDGTLIVRAGETLIGVDANEGKERWRQQLTGGACRYAEADSAGMLFQTAEQVLRLDHSGQPLWAEPSRAEWQFLAHDSGVILVRETVVTTDSRNSAGPTPALGLAWGESLDVSLVALDTRTFRESWRAKLPEQLQLHGAAVAEALGVFCTAQQTETGERVRLIGFHPQDGSKAWSADLPARPDSGPRIVNGVVRCISGETISDFRLADGQPETASGNVSENAEILFTEGHVVLTSPGRRAPLWSYGLPGGVTQFAHAGHTILISGHETKEGGVLPERFAVHATDALGLEGPLKHMVASQLHVADLIIAGLDRGTGRPRWELKQVAGQLAVGGGRVVLLSDTAATGLAAGKGTGQLTVQQLSPTDGSRLWRRKRKDVFLVSPKVVGERLIAVAHERTAGGQPGACIGLLAIQLK